MPAPTQRIVKPLPELPLELWLEIFQFATYVHRSTSIGPLDPFSPRRTSNNVMATNTRALSIRTKLALVLVCKEWKMMTERFLYEHLVIRSPTRASAVLNALIASRSHLSDDAIDIGHGRWPSHIEIFTHARGSNDMRFLRTLFRIFQCCPNVRYLSGSWMHPLPIEFLEAIARLYGSTLQGLYWDEVNITVPFTSSTPHFLCNFKELRVLDLRHYVGCGVDQLSSSPVPQPILPSVTDLLVSARQESLQMASFLALPQLRNLTLCITLHDCHSFKPRVPYSDIRHFLKKHGHSLVSVDLPTPAPYLEPEPDSSSSRHTVEHVKPDLFLEPDICPNLISLVYPITSEPLSSQIHTNIRRIGLRGVSKAEELYPDKQSSTKSHLEGITAKLYPRLQEVRTIGYLVDAETDPLIKDIFIWWVEKFESNGINLLDGEGVLWMYTDPVEVGSEGFKHFPRVNDLDYKLQRSNKTLLAPSATQGVSS
ncbi:hypothetical protein D9756_007652 [Leucocoprinus leucothites]|uniref:F-box domain-containing protein n=1 Tax=Leucocoprinus leucothites TaxID=201217 RepID=A0A8H5D114_9AGAR|nr:hypothetical protein D9756_007652 [Leucoagaricus leucothites]